jgi:hypothetical protein
MFLNEHRVSQKDVKDIAYPGAGPDLHQLNLIKSLKPYCRGSVGFARTGRNETTTPLRSVAFGCCPICIPGPFRTICRSNQRCSTDPILLTLLRQSSHRGP